MLPIALNFEKLPILLIGQGEKLRAREKKLRELGILKLDIVEKDFTSVSFENYPVVLVVGLDDETSLMLYTKAKDAKSIVNVEDDKRYCDFFFPSYLKRGSLVISVSSNGKSPATSRMIRDFLAEIFTSDWSEHIDEIAEKRLEWRSSGKTYDEVNSLTEQYIKQKHWL